MPNLPSLPTPEQVEAWSAPRFRPSRMDFRTLIAAYRALREENDTLVLENAALHAIRDAAEEVVRSAKVWKGCDVCSRTEKHIHCPECGSTEHVAANCEMMG